MKFLIVGLGNTGSDYEHTRHNIGFDIADHLVLKNKGFFNPGRYADVSEFRLKGKQITVIKPTTFMNLSGKALRYWMQELNIPIENVLVLVDDLALPFGTIRLRGNGSDAGHNGLKNIQEILGNANYPRLRFGIGNDFPKGGQIHFVLGKWNEVESKQLTEFINKASDAVECYILQGLPKAMNLFNS